MVRTPSFQGGNAGSMPAGNSCFVLLMKNIVLFNNSMGNSNLSQSNTLAVNPGVLWYSTLAYLGDKKTQQVISAQPNSTKTACDFLKYRYKKGGYITPNQLELPAASFLVWEKRYKYYIKTYGAGLEAPYITTQLEVNLEEAILDMLCRKENNSSPKKVPSEIAKALVKRNQKRKKAKAKRAAKKLATIPPVKIRRRKLDKPVSGGTLMFLEIKGVTQEEQDRIAAVHPSTADVVELTNERWPRGLHTYFLTAVRAAPKTPAGTNFFARWEARKYFVEENIERLGKLIVHDTRHLLDWDGDFSLDELDEETKEWHKILLLALAKASALEDEEEAAEAAKEAAQEQAKQEQAKQEQEQEQAPTGPEPEQ